MQTMFNNLDTLIAKANPNGAPRKVSNPVVKNSTGSRRPHKHIAEQFEFSFVGGAKSTALVVAA